MKQKLISLLGILLLSFTFSSLEAQKKTMTWTSSSEKAVELTSQGVKYFLNIEFARAYEKFNSALELDPDFTVALVLMSNVTNGETRKYYAAKALKSSMNKTEGEKLFASTVQDSITNEKARPIFEKLKNMFPDGNMLAAFYVFTNNNPDDQYKECEAYKLKYPDQAWVNNIMAYYHMQQKKDFVKAKKYFDMYIAAYPDGSNPYDSMGEYYFTKGDMENSEKYYKLALEKYPFNNSSINKLREINDAKKKVDSK